MSDQALIFDLTEKTFPEACLLNSHKIPVVVEFLAAWSGPCFALADRFVDLAREFPEQFVFARVDIDEQPELRKQYKIENVPTTIVFKDGEPARTEMGEMTADEARILLRDFGVYRESDLLREKARDAHLSGDTASAVGLLTQAAKTDPANVRVAMDMVQIFIDVNQPAEARGLLDRLPEGHRQSETGQGLAGQLVFLELAAKTDGIEALTARLSNDADDHDARFDLAICRVTKRDFATALDDLLHIHQHAPEFRDGAAREMFITILNMLPPTDQALVSEYRRRLGSLNS
ncbi:MAG: tetratricopeptide repeat protein [Gammaproteobacteria bacterium]